MKTKDHQFERKDVFMTNRDEELAEILEMINDVRKTAPLVNATMDSVVRLIKEELFRKKDRQTGPAKGQTYWFARGNYARSYTYDADEYDLDICKFCDIYPEGRFAEAELRARKLIQAVNKRRKELNEGKEFGDRQYYIVFLPWTELAIWEQSDQVYASGVAYPFGLFKSSADCEIVVREFEDELKWFYTVYLPLMAELDNYDWAEAPGWGE